VHSTIDSRALPILQYQIREAIMQGLHRRMMDLQSEHVVQSTHPQYSIF
jgi:hypothetical protein